MSDDNMPDRITVLAKEFTPAAMEFHRRHMAEKGYRLEGGITPRQFQVTEIARWLNIPPHFLKDLERSTFSNIEHQALAEAAGIAIARQPRASRTGTKRWRLRSETIVTPVANTMTSGQIWRQASNPRQAGASVMKAARPSTAHRARKAEIV